MQSIVRGFTELGPAGAGAVEHIIMDGASTDNSADLIQKYAKANPGLVSHWRSEPDKGQSDAINQGMAIARGRFATWLNADDWYEPVGFAAMVQRLRQATADAVVGRCHFVDQKGKVVWEPQPPQPICLSNLLSLRSRWFAGQSMVQPEVFFRLDLFRRLGGLNLANHYTMDHELWCRMILAGARFEQMETLVANAGAHPGQKTQDNREVVRAMLSYSLPMAEQHAHVLGARRVQVQTELHAMAGKLHIVDEAIRWWGRAITERDSARRAVPADDQPLPPPQGDAVRARAIAAAVRAFRWRRHVRIGFYEVDAHAVAKVAGALGSRRTLELHVASGSKLAISQSSAAIKPLLSSRSSIETYYGPLMAGTFDLIVVQGLSSRVAAPQSVLSGLWSRLAPGGVLLQIDDPVLNDEVRRYLAFLQARMSENLSKPDDTILHKEADEFLWRIGSMPQLPVPGSLIMGDIVPRLSRDAACRFSKTFGEAADHPLTPFAAVGPRDVTGFGSWSSSVWRKA